ncbi:MAG: hypothetical protein ACLGHM_03225 [Actinomycetes bacterium]
MSDTPAEPHRTWFPLVAAAAVAVLVITGAVVATWLTSRMSPAHADAVRACEAAYAATGDGAPGIVAGDVYGSADWRDLRSFLEAQGVLDSAGADVAVAIAPSADASAAALAEAERDRVTVVWWLESEEHLACTVDVEDGRALDPSATLGSLAEAVTGAVPVAD